ncbi:DUF6602 domain-containing protein [Natranaerobius thermophilus]|uniref:DUF6602 domain-containing protein n=1 Tax=Natranaerobius thermophilus (strain ATCC BAA-1301 / DSM 18059 / JW/NM-WN-LF) TaxID=457570 RepID=B2A3Y7_NATTJ|nr:DUF6602 domain-containing protein [Natranaerobius thermophilus]ACB85089.1 hypothetical protein Nther_1508 [Natranaerobius thermophilus JW/NM-WN-LF]
MNHSTNTSHKKHYCYTLFKNFDKILAELDLVYQLNHNPEKGREAEKILSAFLSEYIPKKYKISTGFVLNHNRGISNQCDILIYDDIEMPNLFSGHANKVIHILSLRAVIESKMNLSDSNMITKENEKFESIKKLYREDPEIKNLLYGEPLTILFAYRSYLDEQKLLTALNKLENKNIDLIFCANLGVFDYYYDEEKREYKYRNILGQSSGWNDPYTTEENYKVTKEKVAFALFYSQLLDKLSQIKLTKNFDDDFSYLNLFMQSSLYLD